jgi:transposase
MNTASPILADGPLLPTDIESCHRVIRDLWTENQHLKEQVIESDAKVAELQQKLDAVLRVTFGRRSERSKDTRKASREAGEDGEKPKRHDHGRSPLPDHLERRVVLHDLSDDEKNCPCCGTPRVCIGEQTAEQLDCDPVPFFVRKTIKKTYACRRCDPTAVPPEDRIQTAGPPTVGPIAKGLCGPGLLAYLLVSKFADHLPLHRLVGMIARSGLAVPESTLGDWVRQAATLLTPLCQLMHQRVLMSPVIWTDDTRSRYLVPGRETAPKGHFWVTIGDATAPYTVFDFTRGYSAEEGPERFLKGFRGYIHADCLKQYESLFANTGVWHVACWAHARRKFLDAGESGQPAVAYIRRLYRIETNLPPPDTSANIEQRRSIRQLQALPILSELKAWLDAESRTALPKSSVGEAIHYVLNHWPAFMRYTERGDLTIDNNLSERTLRPIAIGRNNWTFLGAASAGERAAVHYTIIGTCQHLGLDPFAYLREVLPALHALGDAPTPEQLCDLLPDTWASRRLATNPSTKPTA